MDIVIKGVADEDSLSLIRHLNNFDFSCDVHVVLPDSVLSHIIDDWSKGGVYEEK